MKKKKPNPDAVEFISSLVHETWPGIQEKAFKFEKAVRKIVQKMLEECNNPEK